ncbi:MAG TPA: hypothetical protein VIC87_08430 [Vicinamibacteria bacterium]|jgi:hypothetical protein
MKAESGRRDPLLLPDRDQAGPYYPAGAPVWEPFEGLDALFPDASADPDTHDDED